MKNLSFLKLPENISPLYVQDNWSQSVIHSEQMRI